MGAGETLQVIIDHAAAVENLPESLSADGHTVLRVEQLNETDWEIVVRKRGAGNEAKAGPEECLSKERAEELRRAVTEKYRTVSSEPKGHFPYPVGRESALGLGYQPEWLEAIPAEVVDRFVGVGNPFRLRQPVKGEHVLDVGCGCGLDVYVATQLVGAEGRAVGLDLTAEMLQWASRFATDWPLGNVEFKEGTVGALPFQDDSFNMVISNGVLNLVPDKDVAFRELQRVLRPGGTFAAADLLVTDTIPQKVLSSMDAWST